MVLRDPTNSESVRVSNMEKQSNAYRNDLLRVGSGIKFKHRWQKGKICSDLSNKFVRYIKSVNHLESNGVGLDSGL